MSVICFAALKGGVGKTSLSVNVAHAFAQRGCRSILIDLDPACHATAALKATSPPRVLPSDLGFVDNGAKSTFSRSSGIPVIYQQSRCKSPLAHLFLTNSGLREVNGSWPEGLIWPLRTYFDLIPAGPELRHFLWGRGAKAFAGLFSDFINELRNDYDHIVIDTPPDFNVLTRNAIASSDLVVVPVDSSVMSINSLEEIVTSAQHIKGPVWSIVRSMVNRQARSVQQLSHESLHSRIGITESIITESVGSDDAFEDASDNFIELLHRRDSQQFSSNSTVGGLSNEISDRSPIYLLHASISRTEIQNKLTFLGKTAFDSRSTVKLAEQYVAVAKELEDIISYTEQDDCRMLADTSFISAALQS